MIEFAFASKKMLLALMLMGVVISNGWGQLCQAPITNYCDLVRNGSMDYAPTPPPTTGSVGWACSWANTPDPINPATNTPDYFYTGAGIVFCTNTAVNGGNTIYNIGVPENRFGTQNSVALNAQSHGGYCGFKVIGNIGAGDNHIVYEHFYQQLTSPMIANVVYTVSFQLSLAEYSQFVADEVGIFLSKDAPTNGPDNYHPFSSYANSTSTLNPAQSFTTGTYGYVETNKYTKPNGTIITNTNGWSTFTFNYTAIGGEEYLTVGGFGVNWMSRTAATLPLCFANVGNSGVDEAYYYIDEIHIIAQPSVLTIAATPVCPGQSSTLTSYINGVLNTTVPINWSATPTTAFSVNNQPSTTVGPLGFATTISATFEIAPACFSNTAQVNIVFKDPMVCCYLNPVPALIDTYTVGGAALPGSNINVALATQIWTPESNPFGGYIGHPIGDATTPITVFNKLIIPAGKDVTIRGMVFEFRPRGHANGGTAITGGAKVEVRNSTSSTRGGRLTLDQDANNPANKTIFTTWDKCEDFMWEGVEVWGGYPALPQNTFSTGKEGWFRMRNGSTIEKAYIGALAGRKGYFSASGPFYATLAPNTGGGVIQAYNKSQFLNCTYGTFFTPYSLPNQSVFDNTIFKTDVLFHSVDGAYPIAMALLNTCVDIEFMYCDFINYGPGGTLVYPQNPLVTYEYLYGIKAANTTFKVFGSAAQHGNFLNFNYAIKALYTHDLATPYIDRCDFYNNWRGVYIGSTKLMATVIRNKFMVMRYFANTGTEIKTAYGLYLDGDSGYKVEENEFTTYFYTPGTTDCIGTLVNNSGDQPNEIYKNTYHDIYKGIQTQNLNYGATPVVALTRPNDYGLQLICNIFDRIEDRDMGITSGGIDYHQGSNNQHPALNKFSHSHNVPLENDYFSYGVNGNPHESEIEYVHPSDLLYTPENLWYTAGGPATIGLLYNGTQFDPNTQCLTKLCDNCLPGFPILPIPDLKAKVSDYQSKLDSLNPLINDGMDSSLFLAINSATPRDSVKDLLLSKSPYLSDDVLIATIAPANGFSATNIGDVIIANSPVTARVQDSLNAITLPGSLVSQIAAAQTGVSTRHETLGGIHYYTSEIAFCQNDIVRNYLLTSNTQYVTDSVLDVMDDTTASMDETATDQYIKQGNYAKADSIINLLSQNPDKESVVKLKEILEYLTQNAQPLDSILTNTPYMQRVYDVVGNDRLEGYEKGRIILSLISGNVYEEPIDADFRREQRSMLLAPVTKPIDNSKLATLYPNPNNGQMQLNYKLSEEDIGVLRIMDITGRLIANYTLNNAENILNINQTVLDNGIYIYQVYVNGTIINSDKLIIVK